MVGSGWPVIGQFSSIGSLGPTSSHWLTSEWLTSLSTTRSAGIMSAKTAKLNLVCHTYITSVKGLSTVYSLTTILQCIFNVNSIFNVFLEVIFLLCAMLVHFIDSTGVSYYRKCTEFSRRIQG